MPRTTSGVEPVEVACRVSTAFMFGEVVPIATWLEPLLMKKSVAESRVVAAE